VNDSRRHAAAPIVFLLLNLPAGIVNGFVVVTVPFMAARAGLPVSAIASIIAVALLPNALKVCWSPVADLALTLKTWYRIGAGIAAGALLAVGLLPIRPTTAVLLTTGLFVAVVGVTLIQLPLGGLMALAVPEQLKGRVSGWFQVGHLGGTGLGGGAGVWLASHARTPFVASAVLAGVCLACTVGLWAVAEPDREDADERLGPRLVEIGRELWQLARSPRGALVMALVISPIGVGAANDLWAAVAPEWHVGPDGVALVTGALSAIVMAAGCLVGGWWADRADRRTVYLLTGGVLAAAGLGLGLSPRTPALFVAGTLVYAFVLGICTAAFSALILSAIGRRAATSKYTLVAALGNAPISYMTAFDGWLHDRWSTGVMLTVEALACVVLIGTAAVATSRIRGLAPAASPASA
jgi:MFS family permease